MNVTVDDKTGYVIIDDLTEGVEILPSELYQSYLRYIKKLEEEVAQLKDKLVSIAEKQAEAAVLQQENTRKFGNIIAETARSERGIGLAMGLFMRTKGIPYDMAKQYLHEFTVLWEEAERSGRLPEIEARARARYLADSSSNQP